MQTSPDLMVVRLNVRCGLWEVTRQPRRSSLSIQVSEVWLGGRDSNPDTVVQSHVSYRWTTSQCREVATRGCETSILAETAGKKEKASLTGSPNTNRESSVAAFIRLRLRQVVGADHLLGIRRHRVFRRPGAGLGRIRRPAAALLLLLPPVARHAALAAGLARLLRRPLVRGALLVRRLAAFARDLSLLVPIHRRKATILFSHA